jgi:hypothetical protein
MNVFRSQARAGGLAVAVAAVTLLAAPGLASANENATPKFNFNAKLDPAAARSPDASGRVKFRQPQDDDQIVYLDVKVRRLAPNHSYYLERATDPVVDDNCTGTNWLRLGEGLVPDAIETDEKGEGREDLWRDLAALPEGTQNDIHFRVVDSVTSAVVLVSPCFQFEVRQ